MSSFTHWFSRNPILGREIDHRMRDSRTYFIPMVYILILGLVTFAAYLTVLKTHDPAYNPVEGWVIGKSIFHVLAFTQMALIILLVPSVSAAAITAERDRGTLSLLLVTPMPRSKIVTGKFLASILYVLLLVSTSIPFAALSFGFGGTDLRLLGSTYLCLAAAAVLLGAIGLAVSSVMRRSVPAVLLAYGLVALLVIGSLVAEIVLHIAVKKDFEEFLFAYLNPFTPLFLNLSDEMPFREEKFLFWWITPALYLALSCLCLAITHRRVKQMRE